MIKNEILTDIVGRFVSGKKTVFILSNSNESAIELDKVLNMANIRHGLIGVLIDGVYPKTIKYRCQIIPYKTFENLKDKLSGEGWRQDVIIRETQSDKSFLIGCP